MKKLSNALMKQEHIRKNENGILNLQMPSVKKSNFYPQKQFMSGFYPTLTMTAKAVSNMQICSVPIYATMKRLKRFSKGVY